MEGRVIGVFLGNECTLKGSFAEQQAEWLRAHEASRFVVYENEIKTDDSFDLHSFEKEVIDGADFFYRLKAFLSLIRDYRFDQAILFSQEVPTSLLTELFKEFDWQDLVLMEKEGALLGLAVRLPMEASWFNNIGNEDQVLDLVIEAQKRSLRYKVIGMV